MIAALISHRSIFAFMRARDYLRLRARVAAVNISRRLAVRRRRDTVHFHRYAEYAVAGGCRDAVKQNLICRQPRSRQRYRTTRRSTMRAQLRDAPPYRYAVAVMPFRFRYGFLLRGKEVRGYAEKARCRVC